MAKKKDEEETIYDTSSAALCDCPITSFWQVGSLRRLFLRLSQMGMSMMSST
ncbi:hypothetical protein L914_21472 [Phytophthora nicotianae]|uniref:Uncharacterized protein n=1 Tax=Phytophthora nicotianae TaxID=4792 RepID=W2M5K1_PHYNI|nr:hypothetical protein L914_21472 [Phytophthora nicotianae]